MLLLSRLVPGAEEAALPGKVGGTSGADASVVSDGSRSSPGDSHAEATPILTKFQSLLALDKGHPEKTTGSEARPSPELVEPSRLNAVMVARLAGALEPNRRPEDAKVPIAPSVEPPTVTFVAGVEQTTKEATSMDTYCGGSSAGLSVPTDRCTKTASAEAPPSPNAFGPSIEGTLAAAISGKLSIPASQAPMAAEKPGADPNNGTATTRVAFDPPMPGTSPLERTVLAATTPRGIHSAAKTDLKSALAMPGRARDTYTAAASTASAWTRPTTSARSGEDVVLAIAPPESPSTDALRKPSKGSSAPTASLPQAAATEAPAPYSARRPINESSVEVTSPKAATESIAEVTSPKAATESTAPNATRAQSAEATVPSPTAPFVPGAPAQSTVTEAPPNPTLDDQPAVTLLSPAIDARVDGASIGESVIDSSTDTGNGSTEDAVAPEIPADGASGLVGGPLEHPPMASSKVDRGDRPGTPAGELTHLPLDARMEERWTLARPDSTHQARLLTSDSRLSPLTEEVADGPTLRPQSSSRPAAQDLTSNPSSSDASLPPQLDRSVRPSEAHEGVDGTLVEDRLAARAGHAVSGNASSPTSSDSATVPNVIAPASPPGVAPGVNPLTTANDPLAPMHASDATPTLPNVVGASTAVNQAVIRSAAHGVVELPDLGRIEVTARSANGVMDVRVTPDRPETAAILVPHAEAMASEVRAGGSPNVRVDVEHRSSDLASHGGASGREHEGGGRRNPEPPDPQAVEGAPLSTAQARVRIVL
jgi:hypothetical protein